MILSGPSGSLKVSALRAASISPMRIDRPFSMASQFLITICPMPLLMAECRMTWVFWASLMSCGRTARIRSLTLRPSHFLSTL